MVILWSEKYAVTVCWSQFKFFIPGDCSANSFLLNGLHTTPSLSLDVFLLLEVNSFPCAQVMV